MTMRSRRRSGRGAAALEFGVIVPVMLMLFMGIVQYGIFFWGMSAGSSAASELARRLSVGACSTVTDQQAFAVQRLGSASPAAPTVAVSYQAVNGSPLAAPGERGGNVKVSLRFAVPNLHLPLVPVPNGGTISSDANARVEVLPADAVGSCS